MWLDCKTRAIMTLSAMNNQCTRHSPWSCHESLMLLFTDVVWWKTCKLVRIKISSEKIYSTSLVPASGLSQNTYAFFFNKHHWKSWNTSCQLVWALFIKYQNTKSANLSPKDKVHVSRHLLCTISSQGTNSAKSAVAEHCGLWDSGCTCFVLRVSKVRLRCPVRCERLWFRSSALFHVVCCHWHYFRFSELFYKLLARPINTGRKQCRNSDVHSAPCLRVLHAVINYFFQI